MSLSCIISSNNKIKYETVENNPDWLNKVPWYNTTICSKLHGTLFNQSGLFATVSYLILLFEEMIHDKLK